MKVLYRLPIAILFLAAVGWTAPTIFVYPRADCVVNDRGGSTSFPLWYNLFLGNEQNYSSTYVQFGYTSFQASSVTIPEGNNNIFVQDPQFRNQVTTYLPGEHHNAFGTDYDPSIGLSWYLNGSFATANTDLAACPGMSANGPLPAQFAPLGAANGQTIRLNVFPLRGAGPCTATLQFVDVNGVPIGPPPLALSQSWAPAHLDLVGSSIATAGHRVLVQPQLGNAQGCQSSVQVFASSTGVTAASIQPQQPYYQYDFDPQGLSAGQTLRVNLSASATQRCTTAVSFVDSNGNPLLGGAYYPLTAAPGGANFQDLPSTSVPGLSGWSGGHVDVRPVIYTMPTGSGTNVVGKLVNGILISETCFATAEIFDTLTGITRSVAAPQPVN